jgi:hypothetical protein
MQLIDQKSGLTSNYEPQEVNVSLQDSLIHDPSETSQTIKNLAQASMISTKQAIREQHPDWNEDRVQEEFDEIMKENGAQPVPQNQIGG